MMTTISKQNSRKPIGRRRSKRNRATNSRWSTVGIAFGKKDKKDDGGQRRDSTQLSISGDDDDDPQPRITGGRCPTRDIDEEEEGYKEQCSDCAQAAIKYINQTQGVVYELVDIGDSSAFKGRRFENCFYLHSNFEAKPQGSLPSQTMLFFAELKVGFKLPMTVNHCCILGRVGQGVNGCLACDSDDPIHHPIDQSLFYVGTEQMSFLSG